MTGRRARVLLVDDEPANLVALSAALKPLERELVTAASGEEALRLLLREEFALILLDVRMPGLNGFETAALIKQRERTRHLPIIFVTAISRDTEQVFRGYSEGAVDYLLKPYDPAVLRSKVSVFIDLHEKTAALQESEQLFRTAFDNAPSGMALVSPEGRLLQVNRALGDMLGHPHAELVGRRWDSIVHPEERGEDLPALEEMGEGGRRVHRAGRRFVHADGRVLDVALSVAATVSEGGSGRQLIAQLEDVTERQRAERERAERLRERAARAEAEALYEREHRIVETLQRSLLPDRMPRRSGISIAARYQPGGADVGGDWYDAIELDDGGIGLAMGDVVGHGIGAASTMGELRNALRAYALTEPGPAAVLAKLDHLVSRLQGDQMTTLTYAVIDADWTELRYASAGHLPPLLLGSEGGAEFLWEGRSTPLGVRTDGEYAEGAARLEGGSTLLLYTDGLVEVPGEDLIAGLERLRESVVAGPAEPEALCDHVVGSLLGGHPARDDVALLAFRTLALPQELLRLELPTNPSSVHYARRMLGRWLDQAGASGKEAWEIQLATHEAFANAIEHAYRFGEALMVLEARLADGEVVLTVSDTGGWRKPIEGDRGKGIALMRGLMDHVSVDSGDAGTSVELRRRLSGEGDPAKPAARVGGSG